ncbi:MAG: methyltransferase domain-containing protein, partial [Verrucomicrobia bacterium]
PEVVRTGRPVPRDRRPAEEFARFVEALFAGNLPAAQALQAHLGLRQTTAPCRVLDLGAGSGVWGIGLAEGAPQVRVTAVDWPEVLAVARRLAAEHGVAERFRWIEGDFFEVGLGNDYDLVVLGHILHSEGIERVRRLLERSHEALRPGGRVVIAEFLPADDRSGPLQPLLFAVNMLVNTEAGDTYTLAELTAWLEEAGFEAVETLPVPAVSPLVLARKPAR